MPRLCQPVWNVLFCSERRWHSFHHNRGTPAAKPVWICEARSGRKLLGSSSIVPPRVDVRNSSWEAADEDHGGVREREGSASRDPCGKKRHHTSFAAHFVNNFPRYVRSCTQRRYKLTFFSSQSCHGVVTMGMTCPTPLLFLKPLSPHISQCLNLS